MLIHRSAAKLLLLGHFLFVYNIVDMACEAAMKHLPVSIVIDKIKARIKNNHS